MKQARIPYEAGIRMWAWAGARQSNQNLKCGSCADRERQSQTCKNPFLELAEEKCEVARVWSVMDHGMAGSTHRRLPRLHRLPLIPGPHSCVTCSRPEICMLHRTQPALDIRSPLLSPWHLQTLRHPHKCVCTENLNINSGCVIICTF